MFKTPLLAAVAALALASQASAATIDFTTSGTGAFGSVGVGAATYTSSATSTVFPATAAVSVGAQGLGVSHFLDTQPGQIDGLLGTREVLTITFSWAVNLLDYTLGRIDNGDDYEVSFNGGGFTSFGPGLSNPHTGLGQNNVTSFSIRASGSGIFDNDNFTLASANVAAVPLPAGGLLLIGALGGLAALRRRNARAA